MSGFPSPAASILPVGGRSCSSARFSSAGSAFPAGSPSSVMYRPGRLDIVRAAEFEIRISVIFTPPMVRLTQRVPGRSGGDMRGFNCEVGVFHYGSFLRVLRMVLGIFLAV